MILLPIDLKSTLKALIRNRFIDGRWFTIGNVRALLEKVRVKHYSKTVVWRALKDLEKEGFLESRRYKNMVQFRINPTVAGSKRTPTLLDFIKDMGKKPAVEGAVTSDEIQLEVEEREFPIEKFLDEEILGMSIIQQFLGRILPDVMDVNPIDALVHLLRISKELVEKFSKRVDVSDSLRKEYELEVDRKINNVFFYIRRIFGFYLGVPIKQVREPDSFNGEYVVLVKDPDSLQSTILFDEEKLRKLLEKRIPDDRLIVWEKPDFLEEIFLAGNDTSMYDIIMALRPLIIHPQTYTVVFGVGTYVSAYDKLNKADKNVKVFVHPEPESVRQIYADRKRKPTELGYVITPKDRRKAGEMANRLREVFSNFVQYKLTGEEIKEVSEIGRARAVILDGRIYPLEHTLSDLLDGQHRDYVYPSLVAFLDLVKSVESDPREEKIDGMVMGAVKRPGVHILSPIIISAILFKFADEINNPEDRGALKILEETLIRILESGGRDAFGDEQLSKKLLGSAVENNPEKVKKGLVPRTFAIIRPFYAMEKEFIDARTISDELDGKTETESFWADEVYMGLDKEKGGEIRGLINYALHRTGSRDMAARARVYAELCADARIATYYTLFHPMAVGIIEGREPFKGLFWAVPRIEVLIPHNYHSIAKILSDYTKEQDYTSIYREMVRKYISKSILNTRDEFITLLYSIYPKKEEGEKFLVNFTPPTISHYYAKGEALELAKQYSANLRRSLFRNIRERKTELTEIAESIKEQLNRNIEKYNEEVISLFVALIDTLEAVAKKLEEFPYYGEVE